MQQLIALLAAAGIWLWSIAPAAQDGIISSEAVPPQAPKSAPAPVPLPAPILGPGGQIRQPGNRLAGLENKVGEARHMLKEKHAVVLMTSALEQDRIYVTVRRLGELDRQLTEEEMNTLKEVLKGALFEAVGQSFPLEIEVWELNENNTLTGTIREVDSDRKRILVVNEQRTDSRGNPDAYWAKLDEDGQVKGSGGAGSIGWEELRVGQKVKVWHHGYIATSYPGQTLALKIEAVDAP
ncbi:DUF3221 domain-containing protein [Paenibacillus filicis]|uniref:DUF3221 domain-containing protein n=1 Tax=Paenibacillus filicis TaxID=669464 RepID=A0ABU9DP39_9BACL